MSILCLLFFTGCSRSTEKERACELDDDCKSGHACHNKRCRPWLEVKAYRDKEDKEMARRQATKQKLKEAELLRQSGIQPDSSPGPAEAPLKKKVTRTRAAPGAVRVVETRGKAPIFAACRADERLIAGGCRARDSYVTIRSSYPSRHSGADTIGARWNCDGASTYVNMPMSAYALCQSLDRQQCSNGP